MTEKLKGYKDKALKLLKEKEIEIWDILQIKTDKNEFEGILLPRIETSPPNYIEIKLENNYNVGINVSDISKVEKIGKKEAKYQIPEKEFPKNEDLPNIKLLGTGGTVASRLDYTTGAVIPSFTPGELFSSVPELAEICNLETEIVFEILSENMKPQYWQELANKVETAANSGIEGIVIGHGTDTMGYTAAALSFMLKDLSIPVVLVGSQRSSDRPSSDAALNLINATVAATSDMAEVVLSMLGTTSHKYGFIHRGTLVRKMHSSVRATFRTIDDIPLGVIRDRKVNMLKKDYKRRSNEKTVAKTDFEKKVGLIYYHPGLDDEILHHYIDKGYKGIVLAGTGLGHAGENLYSAIERAIEEKITVLMTVQTLHGFTGMNVYSTGRELLNLGVIPGRNMIPEVGYVKLGWVLGQVNNSDEVSKLLQTNIAGEFLEREIPIAFNYSEKDIENLLKE
ncbi:MAG: Glu-tRNA(Gln) amidotransferase subunit GatD [Promethearchaeia archaeon]